MGKKIKLGDYISKRRKMLHLTQEQLAEKIHVSKSAIAKWELNRGIPDRDNVCSLAQALGISVNELHRIIDSPGAAATEPEVNITGDVIALLESYGYRIVRE